MKVYQAIADAIVKEGIRDVFSLMAEDTANLMVELYERYSDQVRVISARHEQMAMAAADGYARSTGRVGLCVVGRGPAIAQTATTLVGARKRRSKLLVIVPDTPTNRPHDIKRFDQVAFLRSTGVRIVQSRGARTLAADLAKAFQWARDGGGPVVFNIPWDILDGELGSDAFTYEPLPDAFTPRQQRVHPDPELVDMAVAHLLATERPPIIVAGRGAVASDAKDDLIGLAERVGGLLATTLAAKDYFHGHPFNLGVVGSLAIDNTLDMVRRSDVILAVGCSLNMETTFNGQLFEHATVIQIDAVPDSIQAMTPVSLGIIADAKAGIQAINQKLDAEGGDLRARAARFWTDAVREQIAAAQPIQIVEGDHEPEPGKLDPRQVILTLDRILPPDRRVTLDAGHFSRWVVDGLRIQHPQRFVWTADFAAIGQGLGNAIGVQTAYPDEPTFAICGDAGFTMAMPELETAVRHRLPLTVFIMNDSSLGSEYHMLLKLRRPTEPSVIETPEYAEVAKALGARGVTVRSLEELEAVPAHFPKPGDGPLLVDIKITRRVTHRYFK